MNHRQLCEIGAKWLRKPASQNGHGCHFSIYEAACYGENPDVIGFRHGNSGYDVGSILLEAKTSRSDFIADKKKPHRQAGKGMGKWRYFICPKDLIKPEELPEKWGLLYVSDKGRVQIITGAIAVTGERKTLWNGRPSLNRGSREQNFYQFAFDQYDMQNEQNLLVMAHARLQSPEELLYMQRDYSATKQRNFELSTEVRSLQGEIRRLQFRLERGAA